MVSAKEQEMEDTDIWDMVDCKSCFIGTGNMLDSHDRRWNDGLDVFNSFWCRFAIIRNSDWILLL